MGVSGVSARRGRARGGGGERAPAGREGGREHASRRQFAAESSVTEKHSRNEDVTVLEKVESVGLKVPQISMKTVMNDIAIEIAE